jgi:hypothetical protein
VCPHSAERVVVDPVHRCQVRLCFLTEATDRMDRLRMAETSLHIETPSMLVIGCLRKMLDVYFLPVSSATNYAGQCRQAVSCG